MSELRCATKEIVSKINVTSFTLKIHVKSNLILKTCVKWVVMVFHLTINLSPLSQGSFCCELVQIIRKECHLDLKF
jgi:hypothetical protein